MVYHHKITREDSVLLQQTPSENHLPYQIKPFKVTQIYGDQMIARRDEKEKMHKDEKS